MFTKLKENLYGAIQILINPSYLKDRVEAINSSMDLPTGIAIVGKSVQNELKKMADKYPSDEELHLEIERMFIVPPEDKEELKELIKRKQEIEQMEEQHCSTCYRPFKMRCNHKVNK